MSVCLTWTPNHGGKLHFVGVVLRPLFCTMSSTQNVHKGWETRHGKEHASKHFVQHICCPGWRRWRVLPRPRVASYWCPFGGSSHIAKPLVIFSANQLPFETWGVSQMFEPNLPPKITWASYKSGSWYFCWFLALNNPPMGESLGGKSPVELLASRRLSNGWSPWSFLWKGVWAELRKSRGKYGRMPKPRKNHFWHRGL